MKKIAHYITLVFLLCFSASCEKGLSDLNVNETNPTSLDPAILLNQAIINTSFPVKSLVFDVGIVQQMVTPNGGVLAGANFNQDSRDVTTQPMWTAYYQSVIKNTYDALTRSKDLPTRTNMYNMVRIYQSYVFMILTDQYGDIPYSQGAPDSQSASCFPNTNASRTYIQRSFRNLPRRQPRLLPPVTLKPVMYYMRAMWPNGKSSLTRCYCARVCG